MLGISIYLGSEPISKQIPYIRNMREMGFESIFTSLHIPEENQTIYKEQLQALGKVATELEMELMADISPHSLEVLEIEWETADNLLSWGLTGLRIDYGVDEQMIIDLSHKMRIALNASTITKDELNRMKEKGLNVAAVEAWHNYYPRPETGLGFSDFIKKNTELKEAGITVMAFIPGDAKLRGPLFEKLPTLEQHRTVSPFAAFLDLEKVGDVDKIMVGDVTISDASREQFRAYDQGEIVVRAIASKEADKELLKKAAEPFTNRADPARDLVRSVESRSYAQYGATVVHPQNMVERPIGSITIDNERYMRYQGEIQITLTDLPADERVNVLGKVIEADVPILRWLKENQKFRIVWV
ncbi:DUF871 domain-containing protein [Oceanobacillus indicireducens]|uniref:DUF871 domain-containing protein n=1 Tax=Oceanobacillus indicireducens TaxID=1004261 RepID=A0A918D5E2_9BACI|nr:MupG family TIM beta-alpha barrel fold protein [Oceanobacillus indicireducens]GGN66579.1 hypothetical protein GCM10007971_36780 [Oceanobacillus indicireducens]